MVSVLKEWVWVWSMCLVPGSPPRLAHFDLLVTRTPHAMQLRFSKAGVSARTAAGATARSIGSSSHVNASVARVCAPSACPRVPQTAQRAERSVLVRVAEPPALPVSSDIAIEVDNDSDATFTGGLWVTGVASEFRHAQPWPAHNPCFCSPPAASRSGACQGPKPPRPAVGPDWRLP